MDGREGALPFDALRGLCNRSGLGLDVDRLDCCERSSSGSEIRLGLGAALGVLGL
jgi:hypothetical protein